MNRDTFILIAFCVFAPLAGMRLKQRWGNARKIKAEEKINKNQRPKAAAYADEPPEVAERRIRREKRVRRFTILQLFVLGGLMVYMIPALVLNFMAPESADPMNLFLRCLIFMFTIYIFVIGYIRVFGKKKSDTSQKNG